MIFVATEVAATVIHVGLSALLVPFVGVEGACIAFFALYVCHTALIYLIVHARCGFRWSVANLKLLAIFLPMTAFCFGCFVLLPFWAATWLGLAAVSVASLYSLFSLAHMAADTLPQPFQRILSKLLRRQ